MSDSVPSPTSISQDATQFAERLFKDALGAMNVFAVHVGSQLGLYRALADSPGLTPAALAERTGTQERYVREWLEQQAAACNLEVVEASNGKCERHFRLSPGRAEVLTDRDSLNYMAPLAQLVVGSAYPIDRLLEVYRRAGGCPSADTAPICARARPA